MGAMKYASSGYGGDNWGQEQGKWSLCERIELPSLLIVKDDVCLALQVFAGRRSRKPRKDSALGILASLVLVT